MTKKHEKADEGGFEFDGLVRDVQAWADSLGSHVGAAVKAVLVLGSHDPNAKASVAVSADAGGSSVAVKVDG